MTLCNRRVGVAALLLALLCLLAAWQWRGRLFPPEQGPRIHNQDAQQWPTRGTQPLPEMRPTHTPIVVKDAKTVSIPVIWVGEPAGDKPEVPLVTLDGEKTAISGALGTVNVELKLPPDGEYRLDFASVDLFSVDHQIHVAGGQVQILAAFTFIDQKMPVSRGARVRLVASLEGSAFKGPVRVRWYPLGWPRQQPDGSVLQRPQRNVALTLNQPLEQLVPASGIEFHLDTRECSVKKPRPTEFAAPKAGDLLRIELEGLIPLIVDLDEESPGAWIETLKRCNFEANHDIPGSRYVVVEAHAIDHSGRRVPELAGDGMFERVPKDLKSTGGVVDSFTIMVPRPQQDATVHAMLRVYGLTYVAAGQVAAGPYSSEIRLTAKLFAQCALAVTVRDANGRPLRDVPITVDVEYVMRTSAHSLTGPSQTTDANGKAEFKQLPAGEQVFADVMVSSDFRKAGDNPRVKLTPGKVHEVAITLETGDDRVLRVGVSGSGPPPGARLTVIEGDGNGAWFRTSAQEIPAGARQSMFRVRSSYVMVLGKSGSCIFSGALRLDNSDCTITFNLDEAVPVSGRVKDCGGSLLYPYGLSPSILWADALRTSILPFAEIDTKGHFNFSTIADPSNATWHVGKATGEVLSGAALRPAPGDTSRLEFKVESVATSSVEVTVEVGKLKDAQHVEILICPVFMDDGHMLEAQLQWAGRADVKNGKASAVALPHGRYVVFLTYVDVNGAQRFGTWPGMYAEFQSRADLTTQVHLPIK